MPEVVLYILMRTDLASMNPGKACAQATHAANQCIARAPDNSMVQAWAENRGFGTCIVLGVIEAEMREVVRQINDAGHCAGITHDPEYPLQDGDVTHMIALDTCGFVFGDRGVLEPFLNHLSLMP